jgi:NitT/TauT family transport system ATP-binding protein
MPGSGLAYRGLSKVFGDVGDELLALADVDFEVPPGLFVSLVGPSGCGKSTLLKITAGLLRPTTGSADFRGQPITGPDETIGLMLQTPTLFPWRNVVQNICLPLDIRRDKTTDRATRVNEVLELVGLVGFEKRYPRELSGGMQQRAALCRLLISDPDLMLLDEPFGALDEFTREHLNAELARISEHEHKTTLFVTHNIPEAVFLSDVVVVMGTKPGRVLELVNVDLPRPREQKLRGTDEFNAVCVQIRSILGLN